MTADGSHFFEGNKIMDSIDLKLITTLYKNARTCTKDLAESVFLSSPATTARVEKLVNSEIICGFHADVDFEKIGAECMAVVTFAVKEDLPNSFKEFVMKNPHIIECFAVAGGNTHIMFVAFKKLKNLYKFVSELTPFGEVEVNIITDKIKSKCDADIEKLIIDG